MLEHVAALLGGHGPRTSSLAPPMFTHSQQQEKKEEEEEEEQDDRVDSFKAPSNHGTHGTGCNLQPATHVTEEYGLVSFFEHLADNRERKRKMEMIIIIMFPVRIAIWGVDRIRLCIHPSSIISHKMLEYHGISINFSPAFQL